MNLESISLAWSGASVKLGSGANKWDRERWRAYRQIDATAYESYKLVQQFHGTGDEHRLSEREFCIDTCEYARRYCEFYRLLCHLSIDPRLSKPYARKMVAAMHYAKNPEDRL